MLVNTYNIFCSADDCACLAAGNSSDSDIIACGFGFVKLPLFVLVHVSGIGSRKC